MMMMNDDDEDDHDDDDHHDDDTGDDDDDHDEDRDSVDDYSDAAMLMLVVVATVKMVVTMHGPRLRQRGWYQRCVEDSFSDGYHSHHDCYCSWWLLWLLALIFLHWFRQGISDPSLRYAPL